MATGRFDQGMYPQPNKGKPGELQLAVGGALMVVAPAFLLFQGEADKANAQLQERGVVSAASVVSHAERVEHYTGRQGRPRTRTVQVMEVAFDFNAATPYAAWQADGVLQPTAYPALTTSQIDVSSEDIVALPVGAETFVVRLPDDYTTLQLVARLERETSLAYHARLLLGVAALFGVGLALVVVGWRKRRGDG